MKYSTAPNESNTKNNSTTRRPSNSNQHSDHVAMLEAIAGVLKDEVRRGLNLVDNCVNQLAQAKWIILNVDKVLEESFVDCPACALPPPQLASKKKSSSSTGKQNRLRVLPMVSGYTVQRPKINVTRIEQQRVSSSTPAEPPSTAAEALSSPVAGTSSAIAGASLTAASQSQHVPSTAGPSGAGQGAVMRAAFKVRRRPGANKKRASNSSKLSKKKKKKPSTLETFTANPQTSTSTAPLSLPNTPSSSRSSSRNSSSAIATQKKPGPKSKTTDNDSMVPPVLMRERYTASEASSTCSTSSSPNKAPPVLTPYTTIPNSNSDKLKITSISLKRPESAVTSIINTSSPLRKYSDLLNKTGSTASSQESNETAQSSFGNKRVLFTESNEEHNSDEESTSSAGKKVKPAQTACTSSQASVSSPPSVGKSAESYDDLLQKKFQQFREQQRKKEIKKKAEERRAAASENVIEIDCDDKDQEVTSNQDKTTLHQNIEVDKDQEEREEPPDEVYDQGNEEHMEMDVELAPPPEEPYFEDVTSEEILNANLPCFSPDELREAGLDFSNERTASTTIDWQSVMNPSAEFGGDPPPNS